MSQREGGTAANSATEAAIHSDSAAEWQAKLKDEFGTRIDADLITALAYEPGQTYEDVHAILTGLAGDAVDTLRHYDYAEEDSLELRQHGEGTSSSSTPRSASSPPSSTELEQVERALQEWSLIDAKCHDPENLLMTDEEDAAAHDSVQQRREAARIAAGEGVMPIPGAAAGLSGVSGQHIQPEDVQSDDLTHSSIAFLIHAFPSRTPTFLQSMLDDTHGDVSAAVDTLTMLELVESGVLDTDNEAYDAAMKQSRASNSSRVKMADDERHLLDGMGTKKMTKRDRQRRKATQAHTNALGSMASSTPKKVYLNDVRQGGPSRDVNHKRIQSAHVPSDSRKGAAEEAEDDAAMAARLAREERLAVGLPAEEEDEEAKDAAVRDNDWLFSSSVMEQLGLLLRLPSHKVRSVHALCHMNLRATMHRLIFEQCEKYPSLDVLDAVTEQSPGSTRSLLDGLCLMMPNKARPDVERYLRATGGSQDAVLDLAQLADRVELSAAGERTDVLDPRKMDRGASAAVHAPTLSTAGTGEFAWVGGRQPLGSALLMPAASPYSSAAGRSKQKAVEQSVSRQYALERLRAGTPSITFPLNSGHSGQGAEGDGGAGFLQGSGGAETAAEAARLAHEYTSIAQEYRVRRQEYLAKAASSYRSTHNAAISRGPMRGAAAWVYASEASRLDGKSRAFALQAAQATVRYRMLANRNSASMSDGVIGVGGDMVDLHGLTVQQSLNITRQALDAWWPKAASSSRPPPLHIVTGVGRHSRGHVALIRPAVLAMLEREQWRCREAQQGHFLVTGKR